MSEDHSASSTAELSTAIEASSSVKLAPPTLKRKPSATVPLNVVTASRSSGDVALTTSLEAQVASLLLSSDEPKSKKKQARWRLRARPRTAALRRRGQGEDEGDDEAIRFVADSSSSGTLDSLSESESEQEEASRHSNGAKLAVVSPSPTTTSPNFTRSNAKDAANWVEIVESDLASRPTATVKPPSGPRNANTPAAARTAGARNYANPAYVPRGAYWGHDDRSVRGGRGGGGAALATATRGRGRGRGAAFASSSAPHLTPALRGARGTAFTTQRSKLVRGKGEVRGGMLGWSDDEPIVDENAIQGRAVTKIPTAAAVSALRSAVKPITPVWEGPPPPSAPRAMRQKAAAAAAAAVSTNTTAPTPSSVESELLDPQTLQPATATSSKATPLPVRGPSSTQGSSPWDSKWTHDGYEALQAQARNRSGSTYQRGARGGGRRLSLSRGGRMSALTAHEGVARLGSPLARHATSSEDIEQTGTATTSPTQAQSLAAAAPSGPRESAAAIVADSVGDGPPIVSLPSGAGLTRVPSTAPVAAPSVVHTPPPMMPAMPVGFPALPPGFAVDASGVIYDLTRGATLAVGVMPGHASPGAALTPMGLPAPPSSQPQSQQQGGTTYFASTPPPLLVQEQQQTGLASYARDVPPHQAPRPVAIRHPAQAQYASSNAAQRGSASSSGTNEARPPSAVPTHARPGHARSGSSIPASAARVAEFKPSGSSSPLASPGMPAMQLRTSIPSTGDGRATHAQPQPQVQVQAQEQEQQEQRWYAHQQAAQLQAQQVAPRQMYDATMRYATSPYATPSPSSFEYVYPAVPGSPYEFDYDKGTLQHTAYPSTTAAAVGGTTHYNTNSHHQQQEYTQDSYATYERQQNQHHQHQQQQPYTQQQQQQYY